MDITSSPVQWHMEYDSARPSQTMMAGVTYLATTCLKHHSPEQCPKLEPGGCWVHHIFRFTHMLVFDGPVRTG